MKGLDFRRLLVAVSLLSVACEQDPVSVVNDSPGNPALFETGEEVTMSAADQLLENSGMEVGGSEPDGWWTGSAAASSFVLEWSEAAAASGTRSLSIRDAAGASPSFSYWGQGIEVLNPFGMTFELTVSIKLEDVRGEGVSIAIRGDDSSVRNGFAEAFSTTQGRETITGDHDWTTYTVALKHVPSSVDRMTVYLVYLPQTTGTAYFDDAILSVEPTVPVRELQNVGMEVGGSFPDDWWIGGPGATNFDFVWANSIVSAGDRSLSIYRGTSHSNEFAFWAQTIDAQTYALGNARLRVDVHAEGLLGTGAAIAIRVDDTPMPQGSAEAFATTQGRNPIVGTNGWKRYEVILTGIPANARSLTVYLIYLPGASGNVFFDEAELAPS